MWSGREWLIDHITIATGVPFGTKVQEKAQGGQFKRNTISFLTYVNFFLQAHPILEINILP